MSASLAIFTSDPNLLRCQVAHLEKYARLSDERPPASIGVAFVESDSVLLRKKPGDVGTREVGALLADVRSEALLYHSESGSPSQFGGENAMPLRFRRWMYTHHHDVELSPGAKAAVFAALPEFLQRQVKGNTASELVFMTFVHRMRSQGLLEEYDLTGSSVALALGWAVRQVELAEREKGQGRPVKLGAFVSNGRVLAGSRHQSGPLYYTLLEGLPRCERCDIDEQTSDSNPLLHAHRRVRAVALCTDISQLNGFIEVPDASVIGIGRNLDIQIAPLPSI